MSEMTFTEAMLLLWAVGASVAATIFHSKYQEYVFKFHTAAYHIGLMLKDKDVYDAAVAAFNRAQAEHLRGQQK